MENLKGYITQFLPKRKYVSRLVKFCLTWNSQLANYVRGQITIYIVAFMFMILFKIIGLRYYGWQQQSWLGFLTWFHIWAFLAMLPALVWDCLGPVMLLKVIIVFYCGANNRRTVLSLLFGSQLSIHPGTTILFVLLTSGSMFGIWGVLLEFQSAFCKVVQLSLSGTK